MDSNPDCSYTLTTAVSLTSYAILFTGKGHYLKHVQNVLLIRIAADKESTEMSKQVVFWARLSEFVLPRNCCDSTGHGKEQGTEKLKQT